MSRASKVSVSEWPDLLKPGMRLFLPWGPSEPVALFAELEKAPEAASGIHICGAWLPGMGHKDPTRWTPTTTMEAHFAGPELAEGLGDGRVQLLPIGYRLIYQRLATGPHIDLVVLHLSPPDANGQCSLGVNADFAPAVLGNSRKILGLINQSMPYVADGPKVSLDQLDFIVETDTPLITQADGSPSADIVKVAQVIAGMVDDGDTLEFGIGQLPAATMSALKGRTGLRVHSGMITTSVLHAMIDGLIDDAPGAVTTGFAIGSPALYEACGSDPRMAFRPVSHTHDIDVLRNRKGFVGVNSVLEVDLFGQANAEFIGTRPISGQGGLGDFIRGARYAGGKGLVAFASTAKDGQISRIVPRLSTPPTLSRYETDYVVTEHGAAQISQMDTEERARALIGLAAPQHREGLKKAWSEMQR